MKLPAHIAVSVVTGSIVYLLSKSIKLAICSFLAGILIDIDHFLDYFFDRKSIKFNIKDFFYRCNEQKNR